ncbi:MAG TPA: RidA family protein [Acidimicrobiia bacterium]|jgi:enamine deaminase RidA (YjgF/YER057c/UK114 family)
MTRHHLFDPEGLPEARGFSYGAVAAPGRALYLAGITAQQPDGTFPEGIVAQFGEACRRVAMVIREGGGQSTDLVSMTIYTTAPSDYKANLSGLGEVWREVFGRHYPPMALIGVAGLFEPDALIELVGVAVVPDGQTPG